MAKSFNKKHSENADISTSAIFDVDVWPWLYITTHSKFNKIKTQIYQGLIPNFILKNINYKENGLLRPCDLDLKPISIGFEPVRYAAI